MELPFLVAVFRYVFIFPEWKKGLWISNASDVYGEYSQYEYDATRLRDEVFVAFS